MSSIFGEVVGFTLHALAILFGARYVKIERVDFWRAAVVALLSYVTIMILSWLLFPLQFVPLVGWSVGILALGGGTAVAAKYVLDTEWQPALVLGVFVMIVGAVVRVILPFGP